MAKKDIQETEEKVITGNDQISTLLKDNEKDHYNFTKRVEWQVSTGSLQLDAAMGGGIGPSLIRLCGNNNEGKTPAGLEMCRNFLADVPNSRAVWFLAEGRLSKENKERCQMTFTTDPEQWKDGEILIIESNVYELIIRIIKDLVLNNPQDKKYCFAIDSLDGLIRREDLEKPPEEAQKVCGPQVLSKKMMQSLSIGMFKYGHLMIMMSQVTAAPQLNQYEKKPDRGGEFSGGNALLHAADFILSFEKSYPTDFILDNKEGKLNDGKSKAIGKYAKIVLDKSIIETSKKQKIQYPIKFGKKPSGIWVEYEIADLLIMWSLVSKKGAWYAFTPEIHKELAAIDPDAPVQIQGIDKMRQYLESQPEVTKYLFKKFKTLITA